MPADVEAEALVLDRARDAADLDVLFEDERADAAPREHPGRREASGAGAGDDGRFLFLVRHALLSVPSGCETCIVTRPFADARERRASLWCHASRPGYLTFAVRVSMKIDGLTRSEPSGARRSSRWPIAAALVALLSVVLCISAIIPIQSGLALFGITAWFVVPGFLLAWLIYEPAPGRAFAAWVVGPVWGYGLSSLVLLALWTAGVRGSVLLAVPLIGCAVAALAGGLLRGSLTPPPSAGRT